MSATENPYEAFVDLDAPAAHQGGMSIPEMTFRLAVVFVFSLLGVYGIETIRRTGIAPFWGVVELIGLFGISLCAGIWAVSSRRLSNRARALMPLLAGTIIGAGPFFAVMSRGRRALSPTDLLVFAVASAIAAVILYVFGLFGLARATAGTGRSVTERNRSEKK